MSVLKKMEDVPVNMTVKTVYLHVLIIQVITTAVVVKVMNLTVIK